MHVQGHMFPMAKIIVPLHMGFGGGQNTLLWGNSHFPTSLGSQHPRGAGGQVEEGSISAWQPQNFRGGLSHCACQHTLLEHALCTFYLLWLFWALEFLGVKF